MRTFFMMIITCSSLNIGLGQSDELVINNNFLSGTKYYLKNQRATKSDVEKVLVKNQEAYDNFVDANKKFVTSKVFSSIGGFLFGWEMSKLITGREHNEKLALIAAGSIAIAIPFHSSGTKKMKKTVDLYSNESLGRIPKKVNRGIDITFIASLNGIGFRTLF